MPTASSAPNGAVARQRRQRRRRHDPRQHRLQREHQVQALEREVRLVARADRLVAAILAVAPVAPRDVGAPAAAPTGQPAPAPRPRARLARRQQRVARAPAPAIISDHMRSTRLTSSRSQARDPGGSASTAISARPHERDGAASGDRHQWPGQRVAADAVEAARQPHQQRQQHRPDERQRGERRRARRRSARAPSRTPPQNDSGPTTRRAPRPAAAGA